LKFVSGAREDARKEGSTVEEREHQQTTTPMEVVEEEEVLTSEWLHTNLRTERLSHQGEVEWEVEIPMLLAAQVAVFLDPMGTAHLGKAAMEDSVTRAEMEAPHGLEVETTGSREGLALEGTEPLTRATMLGPAEEVAVANTVAEVVAATALLPARWVAEVAEAARVGVLLASAVSLEMFLLLVQSALRLQAGWHCKSHRLTLCIVRATLCS
jgi:hypothetical protein